MKKHRITTGMSEDIVTLLGNTNNYKYHGEIVEKMNNIMHEIEYGYYAKCFYMRLDFSFPVDQSNPKLRIFPTDNTCFCAFIKAFNERLELLGLAPIYLWVREVGSNDAVHQHYHLALWLRGDNVQSMYRIAQEAEKYWGRTLSRVINPETQTMIINVPEVGNGLVDFCNHTAENGIMLRKDDNSYAEIQTKIYTSCLYLCKTATKTHNLPGRNVGSSMAF